MKAPRFIYSAGNSPCCEYKALLVRSRDGGFVSRNCLKCGKPWYVKLNHLPTLDCEICVISRKVIASLKPEQLDGENYFYRCWKCGAKWKVADYLPAWSELFEYSGLAAPGDDHFTR